MCVQRIIRSESSLCAQWIAKDTRFLHADSEEADQTGRMPRLIWVFAGRTGRFVGFVVLRLICTLCLCRQICLDRAKESNRLDRSLKQPNRPRACCKLRRPGPYPYPSRTSRHCKLPNLVIPTPFAFLYTASKVKHRQAIIVERRVTQYLFRYIYSYSIY